MVDEWLDCGNKNITVESNSRYLGFLAGQNLIDDTAKIEGTEIIQPVYIGAHTVVKNSKIGPNVSIGSNCLINDSKIAESLIQNNTSLEDVNFANSMIGNFVRLSGKPDSVSLGDYSEW